jgi:hypothetical protein
LLGDRFDDNPAPYVHQRQTHGGLAKVAIAILQCGPLGFGVTDRSKHERCFSRVKRPKASGPRPGDMPSGADDGILTCAA